MINTTSTTPLPIQLCRAIRRHDPYFAGEVGFTKRPVLLDALDWINGWPTVRAGHWASDTPQPKPAVQPGAQPRDPQHPLPPHKPGRLVPNLSTDFNRATLPAAWRWVRPPAESDYGLEDGTFRFATQAADLFEGSNNAAVLLENAPKHDYLVETRVKLDLPSGGCCFNFVQAGLVIYGDDDNYVKLVHVSI
jgi:arabinan endo-1,5-alpha-L-arabinosidase